MVTESKRLLRATPKTAPWSPLARASVEVGRASVAQLIDSAAREDLSTQIRHYVRGDISGRSFLVAGHRGAGKTTAVLAAMQDVYNDCLGGDDAALHHARPLLVRLHAPSLLVDAPQPAAAGKQSKGTGKPTAPSAAELDSVEGVQRSLRFLQEMAAGIFPALVDELRRVLSWRVLGDGARKGQREGDPGKVLTDDAGHASQQRELIAHLCDRLWRGMELAEVREVFRRLGLIERGLFHDDDDRTFEQLAAIQAASEAYLIVTGKLESGLSWNQQGSSSSDAKSGNGFNGEKIVTALTPVAAALATALGLAKDQLAAGLVAAGGVLISGLTFSTSLTRARSRSASLSREFKADNTVQSLVRRVPLLVEQLRAVGFPVIFVLDELDKLERPAPEKLLDWLLRNLKSYVTERSFLCFVVERSYYEFVYGGGRTPAAAAEAYGVTHTFYSHSAYVVPTHTALHKYLRAVLPWSGATPPQQFYLETSRLVLILRARMHVYDLDRELRRAVETGELEGIFSSSTFFTPPSWLCAALLECAIEWVMSEPKLLARATDNSHFTQIIYDLLYGVSLSWSRGEPTFANDDAVRAHVRSSGATETDHDRLSSALVELLDYLQNPKSLLDSVHAWNDLRRLEHFFPVYDEPSQSDLKDAQYELSKRSPGRAHAAARVKLFATTKARVLANICVTGQSLLDAQGSWRLDPQGYRPGDALEPHESARLTDLTGVREHYRTFDPVAGVSFDELWDRSTQNPDLELAVFDDTRSRHAVSPNDPSAVELLKRFAEQARPAIGLTVVALVGVAVITAIDTARSRSARAASARRDELQLGIRGSTVAERLKAAARLVEKLAELHGIELKPETKALLAWADADKVDAAVELQLQREDFELTATKDPARSVGNQWSASLAERILAGLQSQSLTNDVEERGTLLDLVAALNEWYPPALGKLWSTSVRPLDWSIVVATQLALDQTGTQPGSGTPGWIKVLALSLLGQREQAERVLASLTLDPQGSEGKVCDIAKARWEKLRPDRALFVLLNPGPLMKDWLPVLGVETKALWSRTDADLAAALATPPTAVFAESESPRPPKGVPFVIVKAGTGERPVVAIGDEMTFFGPRSLAEAIAQLADTLKG